MPHSRIIGLVALVMLAGTFTGRARADAGPPAPDLDLSFLFENLDKYPQYDFYLKYQRGPGAGPPQNRGPHLDKLEPGLGRGLMIPALR